MHLHKCTYIWYMYYIFLFQTIHSGVYVPCTYGMLPITSIVSCLATSIFLHPGSSSADWWQHINIQSLNIIDHRFFSVGMSVLAVAIAETYRKICKIVVKCTFLFLPLTPNTLSSPSGNVWLKEQPCKSEACEDKKGKLDMSQTRWHFVFDWKSQADKTQWCGFRSSDTVAVINLISRSTKSPQCFASSSHQQIDGLLPLFFEIRHHILCSDDVIARREGFL